MKRNIGSREIQVLLYLTTLDVKVNTSEIKRNTELGQSSLSSAIYNLLLLKLITEEQGDRNSRIFYLSDKGKRVAKIFTDLEKILNED